MAATNLASVFAQKPFPSFIVHSGYFDTIKRVNKIFPDLGLKNCKKTVVLDMSDSAGQTAQVLLERLAAYINNQLHYYSQSLTHSNVVGLRKLELQLRNMGSRCIKQNSNSQITLNLYEDIVVDADNKTIFKAGEGIFRVYNKLRASIREPAVCALPPLDTIGEFKTFSSQNIPKRKYEIHFSSNGTQGLWDIATMSMRGIQSCQTWGNSRATGLIGSIVDPFTGIIYLTTGDDCTGKGSKMLRRCVVRFVVNRKSKKPLIGIEKMYPSFDQKVYDAFVSFIKEKTKNKFQVMDLYNDGNGVHGYFIPMNEHLKWFDEHCFPYRDSDTPYEGMATSSKMLVQMENRINYILENFGRSAVSALRKVNKTDRAKMPKKQYNALLHSISHGVRCGDFLEERINGLAYEIDELDHDGNLDPYVLINNISKLLQSNIEKNITDCIYNLLEEGLPSSNELPTKKQCRALANIAAAGARAFLQKELDKTTRIIQKRTAKNKHQLVYAKYLN